jgi:ADP-heptose:LPS heptosyltransferase
VAHSLAEAESFLVVRLGALGDSLRVCPAVRRLRRERPNARIAWAVEDWVHPLLAPSRDIGRFHILDRGALRGGGLRALGEWRRFLGEIRDARYEVALDFHSRLKSGLVTRLSGARWRLGYPAGQDTEMNHWFTNVHVRLDDPDESRVLRFLHLLAPLGISTDYDPSELGLPLDPGAVARAREWYEHAGRPEVAVFAGSSQHQAGYNRWPAEKWIALLKRLAAEGLRSVLFWGPAEESFTKEIASAAGPGCASGPETTLPDVMAMIGQFRVFIGSNTAAMHMAWMQGVPTAFFSGPPEPRTHAALPPVPCRVLRADAKVRPGVSKRFQPEVVSAVPVDEAFDAVTSLLSPRAAAVRANEG